HADMKAIGAILWQALTATPYRPDAVTRTEPAARTAHTVRLLATARGRPVPVADGVSDLPESLKRVLDRLLSDDPKEAYPSIEAAAIDLATASKDARLLEKKVKVDAIKREAAKVAKTSKRAGQ